MGFIGHVLPSWNLNHWQCCPRVVRHLEKRVMWYRWPHGQACKTKLELVIRPVLESTHSHSSIERFHMTSRRPYSCSKTMKRRPYWCSKQILRELDLFLMQKFFLVLINLHRWWPTWVKTLYKPVKFSWIFFRKLINVAKKVKHNLKNAKKIKTCRKVCGATCG